MTPDLRRMRRELIRDIKKIIAPHLWESGYVTAINAKKGILAGSRPLMLWVDRDSNGKPTNKEWSLNGFVLDHFEGITELGPITDSYVAIVTTYWAGIPIEDLVKLRAWAEKTLNAA